MLNKFQILKYKKSHRVIKTIQRRKDIKVVNELEGQMNELFKLNYPSVVDGTKQFQSFKEHYLKGRKPNDVGSWVWYPWLKQLVHLLPPKDFQRIRTSRNKYLITEQEQDKYQKTCVAIAGISVGSHIATTLRLQGGAQNLKLADFDTLELSNTNRVAVGITNLGVKKIELVRRRLLEIDPYTKLTLFTRGLTPNNVERFCRKADIIFDEVDNLRIKVLLRQYARISRTPLIMLTDNDDGVLVDYYPYHKDIQTPLFHGLTDKEILRAVNTKKPSTKAEMVRLSSRVVGQKNISPRMTQSLNAVGKTLVSWPQLGTAALLSGVVGAYMTRMITNGHHFQFRRRLIRLNDQLI